MTQANGFSGDREARRASRDAYALGPVLDEALAPIALAFPQAAAPPGLWRRIEAAIDADAASSPAKVIRREEGWRRYTRDVQIKRLWDENTFLLRCAAGGVLPAHDHPRFEHCIILEGDMIVGGETYRSGDYHGMPAHVAHSEITTRTGLLMLVRYQ